MEKQRKSLSINENINLINIHSCSSKTYYINKFSIPKLFENSLFHNSIVVHASRNNYQVIFYFYVKSKKLTVDK